MASGAAGRHSACARLGVFEGPVFSLPHRRLSGLGEGGSSARWGPGWEPRHAVLGQPRGSGKNTGRGGEGLRAWVQIPSLPPSDLLVACFVLGLSFLLSEVKESVRLSQRSGTLDASTVLWVIGSHGKCFGGEWADQNRALGRLIWLLFLCDNRAVGLRVTTYG